MTDRQGQLFETQPPPWEWDAEQDRLVAQVVFSAAPRGTFDYLVPDPWRERLQPGARVRVPLGQSNRAVVGYCLAVRRAAELSGRLKELQQVIDDPPLITRDILELTIWMADYYLCDVGPALEAVLPAGVRGQAGVRQQTVYHAVESTETARIAWTAKQRAVWETLRASGRGWTMAELCEAHHCGSGPVRALWAKGLVRTEQRSVLSAGRESPSSVTAGPLSLNADQKAALDVILAALESEAHETILLHGVTGSGKTEVYIQAIERVMQFGRQAIVLVPEISLTPQTRQRFESRLGQVAVLHSHLTPAERHRQWQRIVRGEVHVVVGARSAVFAPLPRLGLIVIDEEHEPSFKQDTVPRYHARDVAARRAERARIPLLLGSATPSLESWHQAQLGRGRWVEMPRRVNDLPLPHVLVVDLRLEVRQRMGGGGAISRQLHQSICAALSDGGQVILLLNRRGFSTHIQCPACGHVARCPACDIALTHHRAGEQAVCHYCDFRQPTPQRCGQCAFEGIRFGGQGTQRLEAEVRAQFPEASCLRMDTDTMRGPGAHETALERFRRGEVRILLGTQMIAKGLDFPNVTLVGVINADLGLHLPDFRAGERTFQLVTQVAGRTGRGPRGGHVVVQTFSPEHRAIQAAVRHDYRRFATEELSEREAFHYPPFAAVFRCIFRGPDAKAVEQFAVYVAGRLQQRLQQDNVSARLLGPVAAPLARIRDQSRFHLLLQSRDRTGLAEVARGVSATLKSPPQVQWIIDPDAISMM